MTSPSGADDELIIKMTLEARQALDDVTKFRTEINEIKIVVREWAGDSQESIDIVEKALARLISTSQKLAADKSGAFREDLLMKGFSEDAISRLQAFADLHRDALGVAVKEVREEYKQLDRERTQQYKSQEAILKQDAQQTVLAEKQKQTAARESAQERIRQMQQLILLQNEEAKAAKTGFGDSTRAAEQYRQTIKTIQDELKRLQAGGYSLQEAAQGLIRSGQFSTTDVNAAIKSMTSSLSNMGSVAQFVFGSVLGVSAVTVLRQIIQYFGQAIKNGEDFTRSIFQLGLAINSLRREGIDITFQEMTNQIRDLSEEFSYLSKTAITQTVAQVAFLTRELSLSKDQMLLITRTSLALSSILGKDASESARQIAQAISSGYSEALQKAGLNINRVTIAQEAFNLGLTETRTDIQSLTEEIKAQAVLSLIEKQMNDLFPDLIEYMNVTTGKIQGMNSAFQDLSTTIGTRLLPLKAGLADFFGGLADDLTNFINFFTILGIEIARDVATINYVFVRFGENVRSGLNLKDAFDQTIKDTKKFASDFERELAKIYFPEMFGLLPEAGLGIDADDMTNQLNEMYSDLQQTITKEQQKLADRLRDLETDLQNDLARIDRKGNEKRAKIWRDYYDKLDSIARDADNDRAKAARDLGYDLAEIERDYQRDIADARNDYREEELKAERKYQDDLRRLRDEFVFDLEEAVRTRDASQIRTLTRRYLFDKEQLAKDFENEKGERKKNFEQELEDLRRQRDKKLQIRREEYQQTILEIGINEGIARREAEIQRQIALEELKIDLDNEREERRIRYEEQVADAKQAVIDRLEILANGYIEEYDLTSEQVDAIYQKLKEYFGESGLVDQLYIAMKIRTAQTVAEMAAETNAALQEEINRINAVFAQIRSIFSSATNTGLSTPIPPTNSTLIPQHARGGTFLADSPTLAMYGEGGEKEIATFTPYSQFLAMENALRGNSGRDIGGKQSGKVLLQVDLSKDLQLRLKDEISDELAEVIVHVNQLRD